MFGSKWRKCTNTGWCHFHWASSRSVCTIRLPPWRYSFLSAGISQQTELLLYFLRHRAEGWQARVPSKTRLKNGNDPVGLSEKSQAETLGSAHTEKSEGSKRCWCLNVGDQVTGSSPLGTRVLLPSESVRGLAAHVHASHCPAACSLWEGKRITRTKHNKGNLLPRQIP